MKKIKVLMIDDNIHLIDLVKEYFKNHEIVQIIDEAHDGVEGIHKIKEMASQIDLILLDLVMPRKDGIYVLKEIHKKYSKLKVIVETSYNSPEVINEVSNLGANYFILKPFDLADLEERILTMMKVEDSLINVTLRKPDLQSSISTLLHNLGIPSHIKGYQYIREAIRLIYEQPEMVGGITKELYPEVAKTFKTSASRVERAIRHAVEVSWNRGNLELMEEIFGCSVDIDKAKPTNSEFIVTLADKLRLENIGSI